MSLRLAALLATIIPIAATPVTAQMPAPPPTYVLFGGVVRPAGDASDRFNNGYTIGAGVDYYAVPNSAPVGLRLEGSYAKFDARTPSTAVTAATASELAVNVNAVLWAPGQQPSSFSPYLAAGPTFARIRESVRSGDVLLSETTTNHFVGFNAGGGFDIALRAFALRFDARYRHSKNATFRSFPLTVGIRF